MTSVVAPMLPLLIIGLGATVVVPCFSMQPAFGLGVAASRAPRPWQVRLKSVTTHAVFGVGLHAWSTVLSWVQA